MIIYCIYQEPYFLIFCFSCHCCAIIQNRKLFICKTMIATIYKMSALTLVYNYLPRNLISASLRLYILDYLVKFFNYQQTTSKHLLVDLLLFIYTPCLTTKFQYLLGFASAYLRSHTLGHLYYYHDYTFRELFNSSSRTKYISLLFQKCSIIRFSIQLCGIVYFDDA